MAITRTRKSIPAVATKNSDLMAVKKFLKAIGVECKVDSDVIRRGKYGEPVAYKIVVSGLDKEASRAVMGFANRMGIALEIKK
jgi:hypothetical protein